MDPQTRFQALTWLIAFIGGFGMLVIVILAAMWRRHLKRQQRLERELAERHQNTGIHIDTWQAAGERFQPINSPDGTEDPDDPDEDGEDQTWRDGNRGDTWDRDPDEDDPQDEQDEPPWR